MSDLSPHLTALTGDLLAAIRAEDTGRRIASLLGEYAKAHDDWRDYAFAEDEGYTRNLLELNDEYELLLLCWGSGQRSPVHNHEGQDCWMAVLDGPIEEVHFPFPKAPGPLDAGPVRTFARGEVAFIKDEIALHQVRAVDGRAAASLHLYAKPYGQCNCYCEVTGKVTRTPLTYHSVRGVLQAADA